MTYRTRRAFLFITVIFAGLLAMPSAARAQNAYVNDRAGVLDAGAEAELNGILAGLDAKAKAQVAVLTVDTLGGEDIETYAVRVYKKWGIGDKKTSRGVLLLVAVQDHRSRIEVGYGLEGILPDGLTGAIQDKYMVPYFKRGDYSSGVYNGALALASVIAEDSGVSISGAGAGGMRGGAQALPPLTPAQKVIAVLFLIGLAIFVIRHPVLAFFILNSMLRGGGRGGGGGFGGGGFGGFGGGSSGGGGSSRSW